MGKNKLSRNVKDMCVECGIELCYGASALFESNVPEKIIQNTTGHHLLGSLCKCQKTSVEQHQAVSKVLMFTRPTSFQYQVSHQDPVCCKQSKLAAIGVASVFGNLTNRSIGNLTVNINPATAARTTDDEFDELVSSIDLDIC